MNPFRKKKFSNLEDAVKQSNDCRVLSLIMLDHNLVDKDTDFSKLKNLRELYIQGNPIIYDLADFDLPSTIGQLMKLEVLSLLNLPLKIFPHWITTLTNLEYLMVRGTDVTKIPESISELKNLKTLRVENCALAELPKSLNRMDKLSKLELCDTRLIDLNSSLFPKNLKHLDFSGTGCYDPLDLEKLHSELKNTKIYPPSKQKTNH